uniref:Major facilitator superfamily (MFS) profile domain-containing protein n=1 Tax=Glossina brevipalpis TaxID=37001 RepID=A0A1A9WIX8_9MUSC
MPSLESDDVYKEQDDSCAETSTAFTSKSCNELNSTQIYRNAKSKILKTFFIESINKNSYKLPPLEQDMIYFQQRYIDHKSDEFDGYKTARRNASVFSIEGADIRSAIANKNKNENLFTVASNFQRQEDKSSLGFCSFIKTCRSSSRLVLIVVTMALLLENMLLTTVVPVIPGFLFEIRHPDAVFRSFQNSSNLREASTFSVQSESNAGNYSSDENETLHFEMEKLHKELIDVTMDVGYLLASKACVQLLANPIVGPLTHRIGYSIPMFVGYTVLIVSTLMFAFGRSYLALFIARAIQGIGSSCCSVCGIAMLADRYTDDEERGKAMSIALGGLALGVLIGPPFGGVMYEFFGKSAPFVTLSILTIIVAVFQFLILQPKVQKDKHEPTTLKALIMDPYIIAVAIAIMMANIALAVIEPSVPLWMVHTFGASRWEQGMAFLPTCLFYIIATHVFGRLAYKMGRWLTALLGLIIIGVSLITMPLATSNLILIGPTACLGLGFAMVESSMMPELGYLTDIRHTAAYGSVYAIGDIAFCIAFIIGPPLSGILIKAVGFKWTLHGIAYACFLYAPFLILLKNPTKKETKTVEAQVASTNVTTISVYSPPTG